MSENDFLRRLRLRYQRCGYCGRRDRNHRSWTRHGWWSWATCRRCHPDHPGFDEVLLPPPYAKADRPKKGSRRQLAGYREKASR